MSEKELKNVEIGCKTAKNNKQKSVKRKMIKTNLLAVEMFQEGFSFPNKNLIHFVCILPGMLPVHIFK